MKKRTFVLMAVFVMLVSIPAHAATYGVTTSVRLSFSNSKAVCEASVAANYQDDISATLELWEGNRCIATWQKDASTSLVMEETYTVTAGRTYELRLIYSVNGVARPTASEIGYAKP